MANPTTTDRQLQSSRSRLDLLETIAREFATVDVGSTAIAVDGTTDDTWESQAAAEMDLVNLVTSHADTDWVELEDIGSKGSIKLQPGRYKISLNISLRNTDTTVDNAQFRVGIKLDDDTVLWSTGDGVVTTGDVQNGSVHVTRSIPLELTAEDRVQYVCALFASGQNGTHQQNGVSNILIERAG